MTTRLLKSIEVALLSLPLFAIGAAETSRTQWMEVRPADVEGRLWDDVEAPFDRIPVRVKRTLPNVWGNGISPTGQLVDFESDSRNISVKVKYASNHFGEMNFNYVAFSGFDLYIFDQGKWRWAATMGHYTRWALQMTYPLLTNLPPGKRRFRLYLPLRNRLQSVALGTDAGAKTTLIPPRRDRPVVYYGTSIIHGAFACRSGLGLTSRLGRALDWPMVNLGFSGAAKLEPAMAELMAEKEASVYVCDPFHNLSAADIRANFEKFFDVLCAKRPNTPVILLGAPHRCNLWMWPAKEAVEVEKTRLFEALAPKVAAKYGNFRYVPGQNLYGDCEWSMDGVHPNDEAFGNMTKNLAPILRALLPTTGGRGDVNGGATK